MPASYFPFYPGYGALPGQSSVLETFENQVWFGKYEHQDVKGFARILGSARDPGNTNNTDVLRPGLIMAYDASEAGWTNWQPFGVGDVAVPRGVLLVSADVVVNGQNDGKHGHILIKGNLKTDGLISPGSETFGIRGSDYEYLIVRGLRDRFTFDREYANYEGSVLNFIADAVVPEDATGSILTNAGASGTVELTLPNPKAGLKYTITACNAQTLTVAAESDAQILRTGANVSSATLNAIGETIELTAVQLDDSPTFIYTVTNSIGTVVYA